MLLHYKGQQINKCMSKDIIAAYSQYHIVYINTLSGQNIKLLDIRTSTCTLDTQIFSKDSRNSWFYLSLSSIKFDGRGSVYIRRNLHPSRVDIRGAWNQWYSVEHLKQRIQAEISSVSPKLLKHIRKSLNFHFQTYFECNAQ